MMRSSLFAPLRRVIVELPLLFALGAASGCGARDILDTRGAGGGGTTSGTGSTTGTGGAGTCAPGGASSLQGVTIEILSTRCRFTLAEAAAGVAIDYQIVVAADVAGVKPSPQDAGQCGLPGPSGLIIFEDLAGGDQEYCLCDVGLCPPMTTVTTVASGAYPGTFKWDGRNWGGPSDTGNPEGPPFPAGSYTFTVSAVGSVSTPDSEQPFSVTGTLPIEITP